MYVMNGRQLQALARDRRISLGLSQETVATMAGLSRKWVSQFERGKASADFALVFRLLGALDLRVQVLRPGDDNHAAPATESGHSVDLDALLEGGGQWPID